MEADDPYLEDEDAYFSQDGAPEAAPFQPRAIWKAEIEVEPRAFVSIESSNLTTFLKLAVRVTNGEAVA